MQTTSEGLTSIFWPVFSSRATVSRPSTVARRPLNSPGGTLDSSQGCGEPKASGTPGCEAPRLLSGRKASGTPGVRAPRLLSGRKATAQKPRRDVGSHWGVAIIVSQGLRSPSARFTPGYHQTPLRGSALYPCTTSKIEVLATIYKALTSIFRPCFLLVQRYCL